MSDEERRDSGDSLADQAAAWIPPWERPRPPAEADEDSGADGSSDDVVPTTLPPVALGDLREELPRQGQESPTATSELDEPGEPIGAGEPVGADEPDELAEVSASAEPHGAAEIGWARGAGVGADGAGDTAADASAARVPEEKPAGRRRVTAVPEPAPELPDAELRGALEAILLVVDEPVSELVLAQVLEQRAERVGPMLDEIAAGYTAAGHGFELRRAAGGWRLYTRPEYATYVERFVLDGQSVRLTQAALETLAVVAYKQPVTRSRISAIRGVNCDGVIRTLVTRGLVEECGTEADSGAFLYRTTTLFLEKLGLNTVHELPPLAPFLPDDVEELADATR
ncbi:SMC-Scp complex subunit ScpB [Micromonospora sp. CPCC 205539]|uniref:SMC-Scp complex subunit ScpB n=1 Tax=Micromonospora sp. CPCC 205539 TaxID=3122408 RepID=UPI002FF39694